jgi:hypothetical protein
LILQGFLVEMNLKKQQKFRSESTSNYFLRNLLILNYKPRQKNRLYEKTIHSKTGKPSIEQSTIYRNLHPSLRHSCMSDLPSNLQTAY